MKTISAKRQYGLLTCISLVICLICALISNFAQTDFGNVEKKTIQFESPSGYTVSADFLIPDSATAKNPAPAIVWAHGGNANKERSDNFQIEWARRGFVVVSFDLYGHGESEILNDTDWFTNGRGLYDTVEYLTTIAYVDQDRIGVSGHSRGGNTIHESILIDNEREVPLIKSVLYVGRDAIYKDNETASFGYFPGKTNTAQAAEKGANGEYFNYYNDRNVGIIADLYDDFSFKEKDEITGSLKPNPDYLSFNNAKSFLNFGEAPTEHTEAGVGGKWYSKQINGKTAYRVIYTPLGTHSSSVFLSKSATAAISFMEKSFDVSTSLQPTEHIYLLKTVGTGIGLLAFFLFVVSFTLLLVQYEPFSYVSENTGTVMRSNANQEKGRVWLVGLLIANTLFPIVSALILFHYKVDKIIHGFFMQSMPLFYGLWGVVNALFVVTTTVIWYKHYAQKNGIDLSNIDMKITIKKFLQTFALGVFIVFSAFLLAFFIKYVFNVDFRFFQWSIRTFTFERLLQAMKLLPLYLIAYIVPSIFINCLNYNTTFGRTPLKNIFVLSFLNVLAPFVLAVAGYGYFFTTGTNTFYGENTQISDWMVAPLFALLISPFVTRVIYQKTRNPYLGGIINGLIFGIITCVNSQIVFPS